MNQKKMYIVTLILAGLRNRPGRNLATIFCFAFIAANIFSAQYLMAGAAENVDKGVSRMGADLLIVPAQYKQFFEKYQQQSVAIIRIEPSIMSFSTTSVVTTGVQGIAKISPQVWIATLNEPAVSPTPIDVYGFDPATDFVIRPWLQDPLSLPLEAGEVIVGRNITGDEGSKVVLNGHTFTIAGRLDPAQSAVDHTIFLSMDDAYAFSAAGGLPSSAPPVLPGNVNALLVQVEPGADPAMVQSRILLHSQGVAIIGRHFTLVSSSTDIGGLAGIMTMISGIVVLASLPLIALIGAMVAHERQREIGLLMSMGAKKGTIFFLVISESLTLAAIGGLAGVGAGFGIFSILNYLGILSSALQVSFAMPGLADTGVMAGIALFMVIVIGGVSSLWPAYRSSTMNPYDAIRSEAP